MHSSQRSSRHIISPPKLPGNAARGLSWRSLLQDETGGTLVESAVTMMLLLTIIFGIMDCSRALYFDHYVRDAAEEASRYAMVRGSTWNNASCTNVSTGSCTASSTDVTNFVKSMTPFGSTTGLTVTTTWTGKSPTGSQCTTNNVVNNPGCLVKVQVSYNFNFILPILPKNTMVLSSTSAVAISQ